MFSSGVCIASVLLGLEARSEPGEQQRIHAAFPLDLSVLVPYNENIYDKGYLVALI